MLHVLVLNTNDVMLTTFETHTTLLGVAVIDNFPDYRGWLFSRQALQSETINYCKTSRETDYPQ